MTQVHLSSSRTYPIPVERAFDLTLPEPLERLFVNRSWALPPIAGTTQEGVWGTLGQHRTIRLQGPGSMRETLTGLDRPRSFTYRLDQLTGPMAPLVEEVEGRWQFDQAGTGTRVTWSWELTPKSAGAPLMPAFSWMWRGYAAKALGVLEGLLVEGS